MIYPSDVCNAFFFQSAMRDRGLSWKLAKGATKKIYTFIVLTPSCATNCTKLRSSTRCGYNYGWNTFEGSRCNEGFDGADACPDLDRADYVFPTFEYCHFDYDSSSDIVNLCGDRLVTGLSIIG